MAQIQKQPPRLFISYAHEDSEFVHELRTHLAALERTATLSVSSDAGLQPGIDWESQIQREIQDSDIVVLLVSADYLASVSSEREMREAVKAAQAKGARLVPIILRPSLWQDTPLANWQVLPTSGRAVTEYRNRDEAWTDVAKRLRGLVADLSTTPQLPPTGVPAGVVLPLFEVFKPSGIPTITFVEPPRFPALKLSLAQPGRGLVVEGPSGIGKTTALKRAQEMLARDGVVQSESVRILSARRPDHVELLSNLSEHHAGTVVVDDFHRLPKPIRDYLADYLKYLADYEDSDKKLVIAGIPRIGERLIEVSFDIATRLDVFRLGRVEDNLVLQMIEKGARALNVRFGRPHEIAAAANGNLNVAQLLCFHLCALENVEKTQQNARALSASLEDAIARVMEQIEPKFAPTARMFASLGGRRDLTTIELLKQLSTTADGYLSLRDVESERPNLADGISKLLKHKQFDRVYETVPDSKKFLLFEPDAAAVVIDDPQFAFFLAHTPTSKWMRVAGKSQAPKRDQVFVSYSHRDAEWLERLRVHLRPLERDGIVKIWDDTKIRSGSKWREDISNAIDSAKIAVLLISAGFLASDFVIEHELPPLLAAAEEDGAAICPIIVSPSRYLETPALAQFQSINPPHRPLSALNYSEQEEILLSVSRAVESALSRP